MRYLPNTEQERQAMLDSLGIQTTEELFKDIPEEVKLKEAPDIPHPLSEMEVKVHMQKLAQKNRSLDELVSFLGGGFYDHYIPSAVNYIISRGEFFTAYTPYQAEISQGTLQSIYEFQTMIAQLTGMDIANASMYDGATALAEAALMAAAHGRKRHNIVVSSAVNPLYLQVLSSYLQGRAELEIRYIPVRNGITGTSDLEQVIDGDTAAVLIQQPNFFGCLEQGADFAEIAHKQGAKLVVCTDPVSLGILSAPGDYGADIVVGEGQSLGNAPYFGGPGLGFFAAREEFLRSMPGRIVGATVDTQGRRGFTLTLQTREQHIRREKATSNICSNQALNALAASVYMALMGKKGFAETAELCLQKAHYAEEKISSLPGYSRAFPAPFFKEFTVKCPVPAAKVVERLLDRGFLAGIDLGKYYPNMKNYLLFAVTEKRTKEEIDCFAEQLEGIK
ncbi:MAG TPA: aminomethyl-transferring glycine dehydrogenase subunit GcvPA [Clostridia bacterium]|nr:aminomethyl-transferring glycine dehydrogenase subunit GcvPA [Clostridia bacterium]